MSVQQRFIEAIWADELQQNEFDVAGINVYQRNLFASAQRALSISFPTIFTLLDSDVAEELSQDFLRYAPMKQGDWGLWGDKFPTFIASAKVSEVYPYLADCALLDWQIHSALHGKDQTLQQATLQYLSDIEPEHIYVKFNENVKLVTSEYPLGDIFQAHHHQDISQREVAMQRAKNALQTLGEKQVVMVYRSEFQPQIALITLAEALFTDSLMNGNSLSQALDLVKSIESFSFESWLLSAIERNLIHYFEEI